MQLCNSHLIFKNKTNTLILELFQNKKKENVDRTSEVT